MLHFWSYFRTFFCLTVINMTILICHIKKGWIALKSLQHAVAWRRGTGFMDLN